MRHREVASFHHARAGPATVHLHPCVNCSDPALTLKHYAILQVRQGSLSEVLSHR